MKGLSPLNKLNQGFSYVENLEKEEHKAVTSIKQVQEGDLLRIQVKDGHIYARAEQLEERSVRYSNDNGYEWEYDLKTNGNRSARF